VVQASASFDGTIGYGGNSPQIYLGVLASLNNKFVGTPEPWYNIHKLRISVTIRDSSQNVLNPQESTKYTIGYNMWDSPYSSATDQDYASEFQDLVKYFTDLELGLVIPYPIPDLSSVKLPQQFNGVAKDTSSIWAQWATYPDSLFQAQSFPYSDPYHSIKLLVQPNFPKPDVYSISVSVVGERGSCDIGLILGPTTKPYVCSADETLSSSYSFNYVYEADAGVDGDASNSLPKDGGTPRSILHGSYTGFFYGTDTADVYSFSASAGEKIVFSVTPPTSADFSLTIYDPSQN